MDLVSRQLGSKSIWGYVCIVDRELYPSLTEPAQMLRFKPHLSEVTGFVGDFTGIRKLPRWMICDYE